MKDKKRVIRNRIYKCRACGFEQEQETNHTGNTYSWGRYSTCPKCPPFRKYPEYGGSTVWEYVREIPEHKTCVPEVPAAQDWERETLHAKAHPKPKNIVRVWDVLFYLEDENGQMAKDYKGRTQIFDAPDMDVSDFADGVDVKHLRKHSVDE